MVCVVWLTGWTKKRKSGEPSARKTTQTSPEKGKETTTNKTSDSSLKNSWAAYGPGNSNHLEIGVID